MPTNAILLKHPRYNPWWRGGVECQKGRIKLSPKAVVLSGFWMG